MKKVKRIKFWTGKLQYLQADSVACCSWPAITIVSFLDKSWKKIFKVHIPYSFIDIDQISTRMQHLYAREKKALYNIFKMLFSVIYMQDLNKPAGIAKEVT